MDTLLLVDDDASLLELLRMHFEDQTEGSAPRYRVVTARTAQECLRYVAELQPALVMIDMVLPDGSGVDLIPEIKSLAPDAPIVVMTAHHDTPSTIRAMKAGAFDYLHKPFRDIDTLDIVVGRALEMGRVSRRASVLSLHMPESVKLDDVVGDSPRMQEILKELGKVAASRATVLLQGESGTGKELIARVVHAHSHDEPRPFVAINCSAIVDTLLESELFGHERGAFTGAIAAKPGKFEVAEDGTIFLDEIGDMSLALQAKLLRVLQEREFERVGGVKRLRVRARVIAASNRDLAAEATAGTFRGDLYQRLKVLTIHLPTLRERRQDIPRLVVHLLAKINEKVHKRVTRVPEEVMEHLVALPWHGNVRELENVLTRAVVLSPGEVLLRDYLPALQGEAPPEAKAVEPGALASLDEIERQHIEHVFRTCRGHKGKTCEILRISRPTLERKLRKFGLAPAAAEEPAREAAAGRH
ncbi:MAG TPA: sigma-54 dependent transcriptional regulator [Myxococcales bacterium]|nr:sigma-54 dependent transcriptional regulator [Myxococcales bacterium]